MSDTPVKLEPIVIEAAKKAFVAKMGEETTFEGLSIKEMLTLIEGPNWHEYPDPEVANWELVTGYCALYIKMTPDSFELIFS